MKEIRNKTHRASIRSPRVLELKKKNRKHLNVKLGIFLFLFLLVLIGAVFLLRWSSLAITNIHVYGNRIVPIEKIQESVKEELRGYYLWVIPKTNFMLFPKKRIKARLEEDFKRLSSIEISLKDPNTLEISVTEHKALYTWCGTNLDFFTSPSFDDNKQCYFLDESGYVFDKAPYFSGDVYFKFFGPLTGAGDAPLGKNYFPEIFPKIATFLEAIKSEDIKFSSLYMRDDGDIELYMKSSMFSRDSHKILFNRNDDFSKVAENLHASITTEPLRTKLKTLYSNLLYIDLRFGNKVYYKFQE